MNVELKLQTSQRLVLKLLKYTFLRLSLKRNLASLLNLKFELLECINFALSMIADFVAAFTCNCLELP